MIKEIKFCFPVDDKDMLDDCKDTFGNQITIQQEGAVTGFDLIFVAAIPMIGVTVTLMDFILKHFIKSDESPENEKRKSNRKIEVTETRISLYDCEEDEAVQIIKELFGENKHEGNNS